MRSRKSPASRPYQHHGVYAVRRALKAVSEQDSWLDSLGELGTDLKAWRTAIILDLGGDEAISAMERSLVELTVKTYLMLVSVDRFLLAQQSLVNKSKRQLFPVVLQRQQLADALARYLGQLGLRRRVKPAPSLAEYLEGRAANRSGPGDDADPGEAEGPEAGQTREKRKGEHDTAIEPV